MTKMRAVVVAIKAGRWAVEVSKLLDVLVGRALAGPNMEAMVARASISWEEKFGVDEEVLWHPWTVRV